MLIFKLLNSPFYVLIIIVWSFRLGKADDDRVADQTVHFVVLVQERLCKKFIHPLHFQYLL